MHPRNLVRTKAAVYDPVNDNLSSPVDDMRKRCEICWFFLTVGAVSKTIRVNILYSCDSRNCITWKHVLSSVRKQGKSKIQSDAILPEKSQKPGELYLPWKLQ